MGLFVGYERWSIFVLLHSELAITLNKISNTQLLMTDNLRVVCSQSARAVNCFSHDRSITNGEFTMKKKFLCFKQSNFNRKVAQAIGFGNWHRANPQPEQELTEYQEEYQFELLVNKFNESVPKSLEQGLSTGKSMCVIGILPKEYVDFDRPHEFINDIPPHKRLKYLTPYGKELFKVLRSAGLRPNIQASREDDFTTDNLLEAGYFKVYVKLSKLKRRKG